MGPFNKKLALVFLFVFVIFAISSSLTLLKPAVASAQAGSVGISVPVLDLPNLLQNTTANTKEFSLDSILNAAMKVLISNITSSIVTWINSGFQGGPAFITNPDAFLTDVGDQIAGNFIAGTELGFICEPFSLDVRIALNLDYSASGNFAARNFCRLSDAINNVENFAKFTSGDFSQGGWDSWFEITQTPSNNPLGAYQEAQRELALRTSAGQNRELTLLDWGKGFLPSRECVSTDVDTEECVQYGEIKTPGTVIESQLNSVLDTGMRQLELADEFDEIVGALIGQLARTVLTEGLSSFREGGANYNSLSLEVRCSANTSHVTLGEAVVWAANVYGGQPGVPTYFWSGEGISGAETPSVSVTYATSGYKTAAVRVTKGGQNLFRNCNSGVLVE